MGALVDRLAFVADPIDPMFAIALEMYIALYLIKLEFDLTVQLAMGHIPLEYEALFYKAYAGLEHVFSHDLCRWAVSSANNPLTLLQPFNTFGALTSFLKSLRSAIADREPGRHSQLLSLA